MADWVLSDRDRLEAALAELHAATSPPQRDGRLIHTRGGMSAHAALLREIDQTVLRRRLIFTNDRAERLVLIAGERKLETGQDGAEADARPERAPTTEAEGLRALLQRFASGSERVWVRSEPASSAAVVSGVSVQDLAAEAFDPAMACNREEVASFCEEGALAVLDVSPGADPAFYGDTSWCDRLRALDAALAGQAASRERAVSFPQMTLWRGAEGAGISIVRVDTEERRIWIAVDDAALATFMARLQEVFHFFPDAKNHT
jgi:hypothetical protein